jgi:hypothetical protein
LKLWFLLLFPTIGLAMSKSETFIIQIQDRSINVVSPDKKRSLFSVIIKNGSLSDQVGKFTAEGKIIKYVSVRSGETETVEIENKTKSSVTFIPVSPSFQDVQLIFGKKAYEIPTR